MCIYLPASLLTSWYIIIIILTLFQEDNIFGTNARLIYGPQIQRLKEIFTVCTEQAVVSVHRHAESGLPNPYSLGWEVRFIQA